MIVLAGRITGTFVMGIVRDDANALLAHLIVAAFGVGCTCRVSSVIAVVAVAQHAEAVDADIWVLAWRIAKGLIVACAVVTFFVVFAVANVVCLVVIVAVIATCGQANHAEE